MRNLAKKYIDIKSKYKKNITEDIFIGISSIILFSGAYLSDYYLNSENALFASYIILNSKLISGLLGIFVFNILKFEYIEKGIIYNPNNRIFLILGFLYLFSPFAFLIAAIFLRFSIIRGERRENPIVLKAVAQFTIIILMSFFIRYLFLPKSNLSLDFYILIIGVFLLITCFLTAKLNLWIINPIELINKSSKGFGDQFKKIFFRLLLDVYIFLISVIILYIAKNMSSTEESNFFVKIYSTMGISGVFITIIESRIYLLKSKEYANLINVISAFLVLFFILLWAHLVLKCPMLEAVMAGVAGFAGIFLGKELAIFRINFNAREIAIRVVPMFSILAVIYFLSLIYSISLRNLLFIILINLIINLIIFNLYNKVAHE